MIRTILLDAAGTLIEPAEPVASVYARHFAAAGWEISESRMKTAFREVFARALPPAYSTASDGDAAERAWWHQVVAGTARHCGIDPAGGRFDALFEGLFAHYASGTAWRVFPEVPAFLERLRDEGRRLAVVSNFDLRLHRILRDLGIAGAFDTIVTSADASARKPDPAIFRLALKNLGAIPAESVHIGDSPAADGTGAVTAGIRAFILDRPRTTLTHARGWLESKEPP